MTAINFDFDFSKKNKETNNKCSPRTPLKVANSLAFCQVGGNPRFSDTHRFIETSAFLVWMRVRV
jgi:hypothetical protein